MAAGASNARIGRSQRLLSGVWWQLGKSSHVCAFCKAVLVVAVGATALLAWNWMGSGEQQTPSHHRILIQQLKAQVPLLLQMCHSADKPLQHRPGAEASCGSC